MNLPTSQVLLSVSEGWNTSSVSLYLFEKKNGVWQREEGPFLAVVGKNGMGWGKSTLFTVDKPSLSKREGDGRAPAGVFSLDREFGYGNHPEGALPYIRATKELECVDDAASGYYNLLVDTSKHKKTWKSWETMKRDDDLYRWGVTVGHNLPDVEPGRGSCIFLHVWRGPGQGTAGCTALAAENLRKIMRWLDPEKSPVLIQMPRAVYLEGAGSGLPSLE